MTGIRQQLARIFGLNKGKKPKPIVRAEDEFELLKTLWTSAEVTFNHERQRIQLALLHQIAGITGNRPDALLSICYKHVKVTLLRDPAGGEQPRPLIEISFEETKGYLGSKDTNTIGIPEVPKEMLFQYGSCEFLAYSSKRYSARSSQLINWSINTAKLLLSGP